MMTTPTDPTTVQPQAKWMTILGWILTVLPSLMLLMGGAMNLTRNPMAVDGLKQHGYPESSLIPLGIAVVVSTLLYLIPQTCVLGAILLTGYLGGAVATHVRAGEPFLMAIIFGVVIWLALVFRDRRVRSLIPLRQSA